MIRLTRDTIDYQALTEQVRRSHRRGRVVSRLGTRFDRWQGDGRPRL